MLLFLLHYLLFHWLLNAAALVGFRRLQPSLHIQNINEIYFILFFPVGGGTLQDTDLRLQHIILIIDLPEGNPGLHLTVGAQE